MKFQTIVDYMGLTDACQFCGTPLITQMLGNCTPDYRPTYQMNFGHTHWMPYQLPLKNILSEEHLNSEDITYESVMEGDFLHFCYILVNVKHTIFSIDTRSNKIIGDIDKIQRVIWDHKITIVRGCPYGDTHDNKYMSSTEPLMLERKRGIILPFRCELEALEVHIKDRHYLLGSHYSQNKTVLFSLKDNSTVAILPLMGLHRFKCENAVLDKIQTILTFG